MAEFVEVALIDEIPPDSMKVFEIENFRIVICHTGDSYYAFADECTHDGAPISDGSLKNHEVICPRHGARFDVRSGAVTAPPAIVPLETYELKIENERVLVRID